MHSKPYITFIDVQKGYGRVKWDTIFEVAKKDGMDYRDHRVVGNLYRTETAAGN